MCSIHNLSARWHRHTKAEVTQRNQLCDLDLQIIVQETAQLSDQGSIQVEMMDVQDAGKTQQI